MYVESAKQPLPYEYDVIFQPIVVLETEITTVNDWDEFVKALKKLPKFLKLYFEYAVGD
jgi:hypothetical protein